MKGQKTAAREGEVAFGGRQENVVGAETGLGRYWPMEELWKKAVAPSVLCPAPVELGPGLQK